MIKTGKSSGPVALAILPDAAKFSLRVAAGDGNAASGAFGAALPLRIGASAVVGLRTALCLGPDEWTLYTDMDDAPALQAAFASLYAEAPHSLTDISDREVSVAITGPLAAELLSTGCPRDVEAVPVGSGTRTIFDTVQIVLTRQTDTEYRIEVWRSYFPHVWALLNKANRELGSGFG